MKISLVRKKKKSLLHNKFKVIVLGGVAGILLLMKHNIEQYMNPSVTSTGLISNRYVMQYRQVASSFLLQRQNLPKVAVYSGNFGNYRNEINAGIDNINFDSNMDYYFFTDDTAKLQSKFWNVREYPKIPGDEIMSSSRWTSKHVKFHLPEQLKKYDIIVWYDSKIVNQHIESMLSYDEIVARSMKKKLYFLHHPERNTTKQEILKTIELKVENPNNAMAFLKEIEGENLELPLVDTCFIIRVNERPVNDLFEYVYESLRNKGLKRDQNIMSYAVAKMKFPMEEIDVSLIKPVPPIISSPKAKKKPVPSSPKA